MSQSKSTDTLDELRQSIRDIVYKHLKSRYLMEDGEDALKIAVAVTDSPALEAHINTRILAALEGVERRVPPFRMVIENSTDPKWHDPKLATGYNEALRKWRKALELEKEKYR